MLWRVMTDTAAGVNAHAWRAPSALADQVGTAARQWDSAGGTRRLWDKDASLWTGADEAKWLGWLAAVDAGRALLPKLHDMAAGIRDQRDRLPLADPFDRARRALALVVLVQRDEPRLDSQVREQPAGVARVLRGDDVRRLERLDRAQGDVAQVPDGSGHHI